MAKHASKQSLKGTIVSFNISPKGVYEGMVLDRGDEEIAQVNFYPEFGAYVSKKLAVGDKVSLRVEPEEEEENAAHPVYSLLSFSDAGGELCSLEDGHRKVSVKGKVTQLNYALHGEINGAVLDSGDFIHLKPKGAKKAGLKLGLTITAKGELKPSFLDNRVIEVHEINGMEIKDGPKDKPKPKHKKAA